MYGRECCRFTGERCKKEIIAAANAASRATLSPLAADAMLLFETSRTQLIVSFGGVVGINYLAVDRVATALGLDFDELLPHVRILEAAWVERLNSKEK